MRSEFALAALYIFASLALALVLGIAIRSNPKLRIDRFGERAFYGRRPALAWMFTSSGYGRPLSGLYVALFIVALIAHHEVVLLAALLVMQVTSQHVVVHIKQLFNRIRPENWLVRRERDSSFPSGHATTAAVTFGGLGVIAWHEAAPLALRLPACILFLGWSLGIGWSRLALGAHHVTDIAAGYIIGSAWLAAGLTVYYAYY